MDVSDVDDDRVACFFESIQTRNNEEKILVISK